MIQINPLQSYIDGGARAAITTPPSASLVFDLPGKAIWVKGVKLKGTDHTYTFNHDNYITLTNTPDQNNPESEDIKIGVNITTLKKAIDTTYGVVTTTANGLAPKFSNENKLVASAATTYHFLGWTGSTLKWYQAPWRNVRINAETTDCLGVNDTNPLIISAGNGINVTWDSTNKKIVITNSKPDVNHNTDSHVSQLSIDSNKDYPVILKYTDSISNEVSAVRYSSTLLYNPYSKQLKINGNKVITAADIYVGATTSANATVGLVPAATSAQHNYFLKGDGTWANIATTNTWRPIKIEGTEKLGSGTDTGAIDFAAGTGITLAWDNTNKKIVITNSAPDVNHNTDENVKQVDNNNNEWRPILTKNGTGTGTITSSTTFADNVAIHMSNNQLRANYFYTESGDMTTTAMTKVYCSNDNYIRYKTLAQFTSDIIKQAGLNTITITKSLTPTTSWGATGIGTTDIATGTYAIQVIQDSHYYSGIISWYAAAGGMAEEIDLHYNGSGTPTRIYLRTNNGQLQIAADAAYSSTSFTFNFRKLI